MCSSAALWPLIMRGDCHQFPDVGLVGLGRQGVEIAPNKLQYQYHQPTEEHTCSGWCCCRLTIITIIYNLLISKGKYILNLAGLSDRNIFYYRRSMAHTRLEQHATATIRSTSNQPSTWSGLSNLTTCTPTTAALTSPNTKPQTLAMRLTAPRQRKSLCLLIDY